MKYILIFILTACMANAAVVVPMSEDRILDSSGDRREKGFIQIIRGGLRSSTFRAIAMVPMESV